MRALKSFDRESTDLGTPDSDFLTCRRRPATTSSSSTLQEREADPVTEDQRGQPCAMCLRCRIWRYRHRQQRAGL
eukprot:9491106-Pyramimonas_sp.AAC.2